MVWLTQLLHRLSPTRPAAENAAANGETPNFAVDAFPIHVLSDGALVRVKNGVVHIERQDRDVERPIEHVASLHLHGHANATSPAVAALVESGAAVLWRSHSGYPRAFAQGLAPAGVKLRLRQYDAARDEARRFAIARAIVHAKIVGSRGVLRRRGVDGVVLERLSTLARKSLHMRDLNALLGIEGAAGAAYFGAWPGLLRHRGQDLPFGGRSRRPPRDAPNALLSYFYAILAGECLCAAAAAGFDPRLGFLHAERDGRFALALDLLELFRAPVADTAALMALNTGEIGAAHFAQDRAGLLSEAGRRAAIAVLERRLAAPAAKDSALGSACWRNAIEREARRLAGALLSDTPFTPMLRA
jgi:CRISPR-associated protein Cas1